VDQTKDKLANAEKIKRALEKFVFDDEKQCVIVFESSVGNLRAVVGSRKFTDMGPVERQEAVWEFLTKELRREDLVQLYGVHPLDPQEFAVDKFRKFSSTAVSTFFYPDARRASEGQDE